EHRRFEQDLLERFPRRLAQLLSLVELVGREEAAHQQHLGQGVVVEGAHVFSLSMAAITSCTVENLRVGSGCIIFLSSWMTSVGALTTMRFGTGIPVSSWSVTTSCELAPEYGSWPVRSAYRWIPRE